MRVARLAGAAIAAGQLVRCDVNDLREIAERRQPLHRLAADDRGVKLDDLAAQVFEGSLTRSTQLAVPLNDDTATSTVRSDLGSRIAVQFAAVAASANAASSITVSLR
jgi:hypothetical protein